MVELHIVSIENSQSEKLGIITLDLNSELAPKTVENFLNYVKSGHYNDTIFHRVIKNFMIQGGGFDAKMQQKQTLAPIKNEAANGLKNEKFSIAMARTNDPHSASTQFFINTADNHFLNHSGENSQGWGYAVFGKVVKGEDVVQNINTELTTSKHGHQDVPVKTIMIEKALIVDDVN